MIDTGSLRTSQASQGWSRFDEREPFASTYSTPGWQRAQKNRERASARTQRGGPQHGGPTMIEGEILARSSGPQSGYAVGERVFHQKFGYGRVSSVDGNKLTVDFEHSGSKRVLDSFVERH